MPVFTKTNRAILKEGTIDFETGKSQNMGGYRVRLAGEEQNSNDYVIKKTVDEHLHPPYVTTPHTHPTVTDHTHPYSGTGHLHTTSFARSHAFNGYQYLPGGMLMQWGRFTVINGSMKDNPPVPPNGVDNVETGAVLFTAIFGATPFGVQTFIGYYNEPASFEEQEHITSVRGLATTGFTWHIQRHSGYCDSINDAVYIYWQAIGIA